MKILIIGGNEDIIIRGKESEQCLFDKIVAMGHHVSWWRNIELYVKERKNTDERFDIVIAATANQSGKEIKEILESIQQNLIKE